MKLGLKSMLKVDIRRMFTSSLLYIMLLISFFIPILMLIMTTKMGGVDKNGNTVETFKSIADAIGSVSSSSTTEEASMSMTSMCNINLLYFIVGVFLCIFVSEDFRSGYSKNIFTVRYNKHNYVISKTVTIFIGSFMMFILFFLGAIIGGKIAGLPFTIDNISIGNVIATVFTKTFLTLLFIGIFMIFSVIAKDKLWLSICLSLAFGMIFFMVIDVVAPLNSNFINIIISLIGGLIFNIGLSFVSKIILNKTRLI